MRAFLAGLVFIIGVTILSAILAGLGFLLYPLMLVMGFFLWLAFIFAIGILLIWIIGKLLLFIFDSIKKTQ